MRESVGYSAAFKRQVVDELARISPAFSSRERGAFARMGRNVDSPMKPCKHTQTASIP